MQLEFYWDEAGDARARAPHDARDRAPGREVAGFLESDLQGSAAAAEEVLHAIDAVDSGRVPSWERTGNAPVMRATSAEHRSSSMSVRIVRTKVSSVVLATIALRRYWSPTATASSSVRTSHAVCLGTLQLLAQVAVKSMGPGVTTCGITTRPHTFASGCSGDGRRIIHGGQSLGAAFFHLLTAVIISC